MEDRNAQRLAELAVRFGANVQPGQILVVSCEPGKEYLARAIAAEGYRAGARFVDVGWFDPWVKRARIELADEETLEFVPSWYGDRVTAMGEQRCARVALSGPAAPGLFADLDPVRAGRDRLPAVKENVRVVNERLTNWTIVPAPTPAWAAIAYPDDEPERALARLWDAIVRVCRLDEEDPVSAWGRRRDTLTSVAGRLTERGFDALRYEAPGTDLTVGLLPGARWMAARFETVDGIEHMPNLPTEEVFTTPDPRRVDGHVRSTKPLVLIDGTVVRDLEVRFAGGRVVDLTASAGEQTMRTIVARDEGAARLGEVALVDRDGRIGALDTIFYDTLLDENAASHIALGAGFPWMVDEDVRDGVNDSEIHIDFMIGSPEMRVTGVTRDGEQAPVLVEGVWQV